MPPFVALLSITDDITALRMDSAIRLDDKDAEARSIESHRGTIPNAMDLCPELSGQSANSSAGNSSVDAQLYKAFSQTREKIGTVSVGAEPNPTPSGPSISLRENQVSQPASTKSYDFEMDM